MDSTEKYSQENTEEDSDTSINAASKKRKFDDDEEDDENEIDGTKGESDLNETTSKNTKTKVSHLEDGEEAELEEEAPEGENEMIGEENLEQSFDISSSDEDEDADDDNNNKGNLEDDSLDKNDLFDESHNKSSNKDAKLTENDGIKSSSTLETKKTEANLPTKNSKSEVKSNEIEKGESKLAESSATSSSTATTSTASERRKKQTIADNLTREIARKKKLELLEEENKKMQ